jgi:hypothetical protein
MFLLGNIVWAVAALAGGWVSWTAGYVMGSG